MTVIFEPYGALEQLDTNLWHRVGEWRRMPLKRRMTVVRLKNNHLVVHNPFAMAEADYTDLENLGSVEVIVAPNRFHGSDAAHFKNRFPNAKLLVSEGAFEQVCKERLPDGILPFDWPKNIDVELECFEFEGTRWIRENVFFHVESKTLIVTDLCFNMQQELHGTAKKILQLNAAYQKFGPTRVFKYFIVNNRKKMRESFEKIMDWNFDRVIVNHGDVLERNGKALLLEKLKTLNLI